MMNFTQNDGNIGLMPCIIYKQSFTSLGTHTSQSKCQILFFGHPQVPIMQRVLKPYLKGGGAQAFKNANFQALTQDLLKATGGESWMMWAGWCNNHIFLNISDIWGHDPIWRAYVLNGFELGFVRLMWLFRWANLVIRVCESNDFFRLPFQFKSLLNQGGLVLAGGFKDFLFLPLLGEMIQFD